ncbi:hypothetical protein [Novosphingobium rosa]|uniref:hypothetical protein n=1 Tax=Novosphingobium rosa TaxID=76978 RepID=UPI000829665E|nr:hypothetical protein [Novosphingobium rosa]
MQRDHWHGVEFGQLRFATARVGLGLGQRFTDLGKLAATLGDGGDEAAHGGTRLGKVALHILTLA